MIMLPVVVHKKIYNFSVCPLTGKALMAPNLDSFGRDRALYQEHVKRRIAEREARRYSSIEVFPIWDSVYQLSFCCAVFSVNFEGLQKNLHLKHYGSLVFGMLLVHLQTQYDIMK